MKRSRFSDEQIIAIVKEQEAGMATAEVCRRHGISGATFYKWKAKYGGLEVSEAKRLRSLEDENAKLKKLLAEAILDIAVLKDISSKTWLRPTRSGMRSPMVTGAAHRMALHCARQADAERLRGIVQWPAARRMPQRDAVYISGPRQIDPGCLEA